MPLSQKVNRVPEYNKYCLSVRPPPFPIKGAARSGSGRERVAHARATVTVFCISLDAQISQGNGALISRCCMKIHREPTGRGGGGEGEQTRRSVGELQRNWRKKKERRKWGGGEEWEGTRNGSTRFTARPRVRACVRACRTGKPQFRGRASQTSGGKSTDGQTRSRGNSQYLSTRDADHARPGIASSPAGAGISQAGARCARGGCTAIIRASCFLVRGTGLKDVKYA